MKAEITKTTTLTLNEDEARWLKELMQNPLNESESYVDKLIRQDFFVALGGTISAPPAIYDDDIPF